MNVFRGLVFLALFTVLAVCAVHLRAEQVRMTANVQSLRRERVELRRESWVLQTQIARLRAPNQIRDRVEHWDLAVHAPMPELGPDQTPRFAWR